MAFSSDKEMKQFQSRLHDLARKSYQQGVYTFTGFLGLGEQDLFWQEERELAYAGYTFWGGSRECDRKVLRFGKPEELGYEQPFGIACIHIAPLMEKFSDDFSHRDFLGALMNLGIDRSTLGDIRAGLREAYLFCLDGIAPYICDNLEQVKHTRVRCSVIEEAAAVPEEEPQVVRIQVASERADAVVARVYGKSRSDAAELFGGKKVFVGGRLCEDVSRILKPQETVNVRGFGKFIYLGAEGETRKGKLNVRAALYR